MNSSAFQQIPELVVDLNALGNSDVERVGGKNASLGEMLSHLGKAGVRVPGGFATTVQAYRDFLVRSGLYDRIYRLLDELNSDDIQQLTQACVFRSIRPPIPLTSGH